LRIAYGKFKAYLAALYSPSGNYQALTNNVAGFLENLPFDVLPVSIKSKSRLHDLGIHILSQIAAMPVGPLLSQFGPEGKTISELACGHDDTPLLPRRWEEIIEESIALSSVTVSLEAVLITVESLLYGVFARDALKGKGIVSIKLWTRSLGAAHWERSIRFREAATDMKTAVSRIKEMGIKVTALGHRTGRQSSFFTEVRVKDHLMNDIKQLELRLGSPEVFTIKEVEPWSRIPERRYALAPVSC
jgi:DNA polymerase-4